MLREAGLKNVRIDAEGNVIAERPGANARPNVVVSAHLDTVFPRGTNVKVRRDGYVLRGPGIGDDCRGLADRACGRESAEQGRRHHARYDHFRCHRRRRRAWRPARRETPVQRDVEGQNRSLRLDRRRRARRHAHRHRQRAVPRHLQRAGGHSFGSFGIVNPIHALGRAMARIADFQVPSSPRTTFNVGRIGGGTSINAIPSEAWMEVDLRSGDTASLRALEKQFRQAVNDAVAQENARWSSTALTCDDRNRRHASRRARCPRRRRSSRPRSRSRRR